MNNLKTYFASPGKSCTNGTPLPAVSPSAQENVEDSEKVASRVCELQSANGADVESHESNSPLYIIKKPSVNSKLILQNMEEVLNSVKKKHRQKHRRKKEQKKLAQLEAEAVAVAMKAKADEEISSSSHTEVMQGLSKKPLCENSGQGRNSKDQMSKLKLKQAEIKKTPLKSGTVPKHTGSPNTSEHILGLKSNEHNQINTRSKEKEHTRTAVTARTNAFEVMMNARNKSMGSNSPGKEVACHEEASAPARNVKRKLLLQDWADRKGANKRKLEEASRAAYVEEQLECRAKRFKKMLTTAVSSPKTTPDSQELTGTRKSKRKESTRVKQSKNMENEIQKSKHTHCGGKGRSASTESADELSGEGLGVEDLDTIEFLKKLSSPTKKRDNLLGFFPKREAQKTDPKVVNEMEDSQKRLRRSNCGKRNTREDTLPFKEVPGDESTTPARTSDRPRRSCADRARYDYDLEVSPTEVSKPPKIAKPTAPQTIIVSDEEIEAHDLDDTKSKVPQQKKLAPLFWRTLPKPSPDPTFVKARQDFLMSGVPEKLRIEQVKQKQFEQNYEETLELFPKTSHVQQLTTSEMDWLGKSVAFTFKWQLTEEESSVNAAKTRRSKGKKGREIGSITRREKATVPTPLLCQEPLHPVPDKRLIIKAWKAGYERFPIYRCYNQMREKYRYFSAIDSGQDTEQVTESFVFTRRSSRSIQGVEQREQDVSLDDAKPPAMAPNGELMFTEKYKPLFFEQFLVNLSPVSELRDFLVNWAAAGSRHSQAAGEGLDSENESNSSNHQALCNTVVLLGPSSSGKTSSVFAVANELNFNVLEINAGMKRTGKKLIQELQEATQSHQLRKNASAQGKTQKSLLKLSLDGLKSKAKQSAGKNPDGEGNTSSNAAESNTTAARKCLILIEDADIVFDQVDAGFTDAIYTLAASSKRPVIIVASNVTCPHLQRLIQQNTIYFKEPNTLNISRYMSVLALLENCPINLEDLISLYIYNKKDLRKTLLELQFFIQSGGDRTKERQIASETPSLFASPTKRRFSEESNNAQGTANDDLPNKETAVTQPDVVSNLHMHQNLFHFFTAPQNQKWRIPYPVDFNLLRHNLDDIFQVSKKLILEELKSPGKPSKPVECTAKRKSRSPKKVWLTAAAAQQVLPLADLCAFYENVSIACSLGLRGSDKSSLEESRTLCGSHVMAKDIVHNLVASAIDCNLEAKQFAYNLIYSPMKKITLADGPATSAVLRNRHSLALDFEPTLRSICRSEKSRAAQERRSTRFYHYLRSSFDIPGGRLQNACMVFMEHEDSCSQASEPDAVDSMKT